MIRALTEMRKRRNSFVPRLVVPATRAAPASEVMGGGSSNAVRPVISPTSRTRG